jgi:desampylase
MTPPREGMEGVLARLVALAEASPEHEVCGFVLEAPLGLILLYPTRNVAEDTTRAFQIAPSEVLRTLRGADDGGCRVLAVYHSHPFGGADLSSRDLAELVVDGCPVLPGAELWVVALERGIAKEIRVFGWADGRYERLTEGPGQFTL